jgi:hypothetical protein
MSQVHVYLERPDAEADEAFALHAGEIDAGDLIDELEDEELEKEEALETVLEAEHGVDGVEVVANDVDDQVDADDIEAGLDQLLLLRTVGEEELEEFEGWATAVGEEDVLVPRRHRGEFVCRGCFLVKARTQLADRDRHLCLDCV